MTSTARMAGDCVIHYSEINFSDNLTPVNEVRYQKLCEAKQARDKLGGKYLHSEQSHKIPSTFQYGLQYHRECYCNYTRVMRDVRKREPLCEIQVSANQCSSRPHRNKEMDHAGRFPQHCMFCKKTTPKRIRSNGKNVYEMVSCFKHSSVHDTLREAAILKNDQSFLCGIEGVDLIQKKFRRHSSCYLDYTEVCRKKMVRNSSIDQYEKVRTAISDIIFAERRCMSLDELLELKGEEIKNHTTRQNMKRWIERNYEEKVIFLTTQNNLSKVVVSAEVWNEITTGTKPLNSSITSNDEKSTIKEAAEILRDVILTYVKSAEKLPWPPTVDSLRDRLTSFPEVLTQFFRILVSPKNHHHVTSDTINRHVDSLAQDIIFSITKGTFLTLKHTCLGLGLHSMTGMKIPIVILSHLGHSISYDRVMEIETAQAEVSQQFDTQSQCLPIQPKNQCSVVPTVFWFDNYDAFVDNNTGADSIHNTPGIAFQEETLDSVRRSTVSIPKSRKRSLDDESDSPSQKIPKIKPKTNPPLLSNASQNPKTNKNQLLSLWKTLRYNFRGDQRFSRYTGFVIQVSKTSQPKTVMTYLPPIEKPISLK